MTDAERKVMELLGSAWNAFLELPIQHPDDIDEFRHGLHRLQEKIMARTVRRTDPSLFCELNNVDA